MSLSFKWAFSITGTIVVLALLDACPLHKKTFSHNRVSSLRLPSVLHRSALLHLIGLSAMMGSTSSGCNSCRAVTAAWLLVLLRLGVASSISIKRDVNPTLPADPDTKATCTSWYGNNEGWLYHEVRDAFRITPANFTGWNRSITVSCGNWKEQTFSVEVRGE